MFDPGRQRWLLHAYDRAERPVVARKRLWTAIAESEQAVVREMARCLREINAGREPE